MALASPIYAVNELLMYVISKLDTDDQNDNKNVVNTFYGDEAVSDVKSLLWEHYSSNPDCSITKRAKVKIIDDILDAIRIINYQLSRVVCGKSSSCSRTPDCRSAGQTHYANSR